jgi:hypothetical protein
MLRSIPPSGLLLAGVVALFLLVVGFRTDGLPYVRGAQFSDSTTAHYPAALHFARSFQTSDLRQSLIWQETTMGGQFFAANPLNKVSYPFQWLARFIPPTLHLNIMIALHILIAALGMWHFSRLLGQNQPAALIAAITYALAPRLSAHLAAGHLDILYALAWFPWLMASAHRLSAPTATLRTTLIFAIFAALSLNADVRLSLFAFALAGAYILTRLFQPQRWCIFRRALYGGIIALVFSTALLIPLILSQAELTRSSLTANDAAIFSLDFPNLVGIFIPPPAGNVETLPYLGIAALLLAAIGALHQPRTKSFWLIAMLIAFLYALGANTLVWQTLTRVFPFLLWFRVPSRAWLVIVFIVPLLAGFGTDTLRALFDQAIRNPRLRSLRPMRLSLAIVLLLSLIIGGFFALTIPSLASSGAQLALVGASTAITILIMLSGKLKPNHAIPALCALLLTDALWFGRAWIVWRTESEWLAPYANVAQILHADNARRIYSPNYAIPQEAIAYYDLRLFGGVDPYQIRYPAEAIIEASGVQSSGYSVVLPPLDGGEGDDLSNVNRNAVPNTQILAEWDVTHTVATYPMQHPRLEFFQQVDNFYIYRNLDWEMPQVSDSILPTYPNSGKVPNFNIGVVFSATGLGYSISILSGILAFSLFVYLTYTSKRKIL